MLRSIQREDKPPQLMMILLTILLQIPLLPPLPQLILIRNQKNCNPLFLPPEANRCMGGKDNDSNNNSDSKEDKEVDADNAINNNSAIGQTSGMVAEDYSSPEKIITMTMMTHHQKVMMITIMI